MYAISQTLYMYDLVYLHQWMVNPGSMHAYIYIYSSPMECLGIDFEYFRRINRGTVLKIPCRLLKRA